MSKAAYWQRGETIDYKNTGSTAIEANSVIVLGQRIAVAGMTIQPGETGSLHVKGIYQFEKDEGEIEAGAEVYYSAEEKMTASATSGEGSAAVSNLLAGFAAEAAAAADKTVLVSINA